MLRLSDWYEKHRIRCTELSQVATWLLCKPNDLVRDTMPIKRLCEESDKAWCLQKRDQGLCSNLHFHEWEDE